MVGRRVMFTPKGYFVMPLVLRISLRRSSGVGCVRAVSYMFSAQEPYGFSEEETHETETACVGDGRSKLGVSYPLHATLHNGYWI
jgi:hypothetical protein